MVYIQLGKTSINHEGHTNPITESKGIAILMGGGTLPISEVASGRVNIHSFHSIVRLNSFYSLCNSAPKK